MEIKCPHCLGEIDESAIVCKHCTRLVKEYANCPECAEIISQKAVVCPNCKYDFRTAEDKNNKNALYEEFIKNLNVTVIANPIGAMLSEASLTALFLPPQIIINGENIVFKKWLLFGLRSFDQKITIQKAASVRILDGIFWAEIIIETFGGAMADFVLKGLDKEEAKRTMQILEKMISFRK